MGEFLNAEPKDRYAWTRRRFFMYVVAGFCMACVSYILYTGSDTRVSETIATMAFVTLISLAGSYVFGATWQDVSQIKFGGRRPE